MPTYELIKYTLKADSFATLATYYEKIGIVSVPENNPMVG